MFKLTKEKALEIQAEQIKYYSKWVPDLANRVAKITNAEPLQSGIEYDILTINRHIPRGGDIERIAYEHNKYNLNA